MSEIINVIFEIIKPYWPVLVSCAFLSIIILFLSFLYYFFFPSWLLGRELRKAKDSLIQIKERQQKQIVDLEEIAREAMAEERLSHLWSEYVETLHPEKKTDNSGQAVINRWRATAMAEAFLTEQALVDTPLKTEFFKHLPGILTGLGIIGICIMIDNSNVFPIHHNRNQGKKVTHSNFNVCAIKLVHPLFVPKALNIHNGML